MTGFVIVASLMVLTAIAFVLTPLVRRSGSTQPTSFGEANLQVYRSQLQEMQADVDNGTLASDTLEASRLELQRRMLDDVAAPDAAALARSTRRPKTAVAIALAIPVVAGLLYWHLGTPAALTGVDGSMAAMPHGDAHGMSFEQIDTLAQRLAERLAQQSDDAEGWAMLARSYNVLGRHAQAASAYARAAELVPRDAELLADYADALAMAQGGSLNGKPIALIQRALKIDPRNVKALALAGTAAFDRRDYRNAASFWQRGVEAAAPDDGFAEALRANLAEARALVAGGSATPVKDAPVTASGAGRRIAGQVSLAPELLTRAAADDTVFVFARAATGPSMPLALLRRQVKDLPLEFVLDDAAAMRPGVKLSDFERVVVVARVSKGGTAQPRPGDLEGSSGTIANSADGVRIRIDHALR